MAIVRRSHSTCCESQFMSEAGDTQTDAVDPDVVVAKPRTGWTEDWLAVVLGLAVLIGLWATVKTVDGKAESSVSAYVGKVGGWTENPIDALSKSPVGLLGVAVISATVFGVGIALLKKSPTKFLLGFAGIFALAILAEAMASQSVMKHYGLSSALWALLLGLLIANTVGLPGWLKPAALTEFYIKTGLVLLGAEVLLPKLVALGVPGIFVAWVVTPIVLITTYWFGQRVLKIESKSLNMVVAADMSVCGVSAAIATAAACKAKKEELSLAVAMSLMFTVVMMVVMPGVVTALGMDPILGGAWMGGTIDSTGAVAAAGEFLKDEEHGDAPLYVATTVKMIQNILIGVTALCVAIYWTTVVERDENGTKVGAGEIWKRFPKFVIGFVLASIVFSLVYQLLTDGPAIVSATTGVTKTLRGWWFALAFVSIGLESNFREFARTLSGGKPLLLYLCGQTLNLCLTLGMAWLMFRVIFKDWVETALAK